MKNIIAISSLLAAGTVFASADVTTWDKVGTTDKSITTDKSTTSWDVSSSSQAFNTEWSLIFTVSKDSFTTGTSLTLLALDTKNNGSEKNNFSGLMGITSSGTDVSFTHYNKATKTGGSISSAVSDITFVLSRNSGENVSVKAYADGKFDTALWTSEAATGQKYVSTTLTQLNFGFYDSSYTSGATFLSNDKVGTYTLLGAGYTFGSIVSTTELKSYYSSSIPEPSAFGLLAGVGALALVAARRRRRAM